MARQKQYIESEVIEKAMLLFWSQGYENTSMQMLEKEMGINKFSIYSSFGSKHGLFLESLASYKERIRSVFDRFSDSSNGIDSIKQFFYDSVDVCHRDGNKKGCLITNTYNEFFDSDDTKVNSQMSEFMDGLKEVFISKLRMDESKDDDTIQRQANYLLLAKHGLATASKVNSRQEIEDYIETTFQNI